MGTGLKSQAGGPSPLLDSLGWKRGGNLEGTKQSIAKVPGAKDRLLKSGHKAMEKASKRWLKSSLSNWSSKSRSKIALFPFWGWWWS